MAYLAAGGNLYWCESWVTRDERTTGSLVAGTDIRRREAVTATCAAAAANMAEWRIAASLRDDLYSDEAAEVEYEITTPAGHVLYRGRVRARGTGRVTSQPGESRTARQGSSPRQGSLL